jgi:hypothetical protein
LRPGDFGPPTGEVRSLPTIPPVEVFRAGATPDESYDRRVAEVQMPVREIRTDTREKLEAIEGNLREAAGIQDDLVRKILTAILHRQAEHYRKLDHLEREPRDRPA